jgi:hypothetical protein
MSKDQKPRPKGESTDPDPNKKRQMDDNIDDLGRKPDGSKLDQPGKSKPSEQR